MDKIGKLNFGTQIVPIKSEKPMTPQEKAELKEVKKVLDENLGKDIVSFNIKDPNNIDIIVNHPDPKVEKEIAQKMMQMSEAAAPQAATKPSTLDKAPQSTPSPTGQQLNLVG